VLPKGKLGIHLAEWMNDVPPDSTRSSSREWPNLSWNEMNSFMVLCRLSGTESATIRATRTSAGYRARRFGPSSSTRGARVRRTRRRVQRRRGCSEIARVLGDVVERLGRRQEQAADTRSNQEEHRRRDPVLAIDLVEVPEWGVIIGYQKNGQELLCHTYFDKHKSYEVAQKFPFAVVILKRDGPVPGYDASIKPGFGIVVQNLTTEKYSEYFSGLAAFDKWMARLRDDDFAKLDSAKLWNVVQANQWIFQRLVADRKTGMQYLDIVAK